MSKTINITINEETANERVDIALAKTTQLSRSMIQKLIYANHIRCDNELISKPNFITKVGQEYEIIELAPNIDHIVEQEGELNILFEDEHIIILNKKAGIVVHPGAGNWSGTMINHIAHYLAKSKENLSNYNISDYNGNLRLGVVHRLDKDVSGCIIIAKTNQAHMILGQQFQERLIKKEYIALCYGKHAQNVPNGQEWGGVAQDYIARSNVDRKKMMCVPSIEQNYKHKTNQANEQYFDKNKDNNLEPKNFQGNNLAEFKNNIFEKIKDKFAQDDINISEDAAEIYEEDEEYNQKTQVDMINTYNQEGNIQRLSKNYQQPKNKLESEQPNQEKDEKNAPKNSNQKNYDSNNWQKLMINEQYITKISKKRDNTSVDQAVQSGKYSSMEYKIKSCKYVDSKIGFISQVECFPVTGRMHQIRLQLSQRKLPIIGDTLYGKKQNDQINSILGNRIALHAHAISFMHPITKQFMRIIAPIPTIFETIMKN